MCPIAATGKIKGDTVALGSCEKFLTEKLIDSYFKSHAQPADMSGRTTFEYQKVEIKELVSNR